MSDRVACAACGKWMFHLAQSCPHCGVVRAGAPPAPVVAAPAPKAPPKKVEMSPEEVRSLLAAAVPPAELNMTDVMTDLVLPRRSNLDLLLSLLALPLTALTLAALGYGVLQTMKKKTAVNLRAARLIAVPTGAALAAMFLDRNEASVRWWVALAGSLGAFFVRDVLRARSRRDPLA